MVDYIAVDCPLYTSQIEAKFVLVCLLQTYTLTLSDDYTIRNSLNLDSSFYWRDSLYNSAKKIVRVHHEN